MTPEEREQIARMFEKATRIMDRLATIALQLQTRISVLEEKMTVHIGDDNDSETKESFIFLTPDCDISSLVHECWHVIFHMMTYFEAKFEDEVVAYHLGYLTQQVYDFVKKRR